MLHCSTLFDRTLVFYSTYSFRENFLCRFLLKFSFDYLITAICSRHLKFGMYFLCKLYSKIKQYNIWAIHVVKKDENQFKQYVHCLISFIMQIMANVTCDVVIIVEVQDSNLNPLTYFLIQNTKLSVNQYRLLNQWMSDVLWILNRWLNAAT